MNLCFFVVVLSEVLGVREYGKYELYRQVGNVIYDYSGNGFHGRNGNSVLSDSNDGVFTDRGIYLDGASTYFLAHSNEFGQGPQFTNEWSFSMWIHPLSLGTVMHRISDQGNTVFKFSLNPTNTVFLFNINCPPCNLYTDTLPLALTVIYWMLLTINVHNNQYDLYENHQLHLSNSIGGVYSDKDSYSFTYIGTDSSDFQRSFVYYIEFNSGGPLISNLVSTSNSGCNGYCYFSTSSSSVCNCSGCALVVSSQCLSDCTDPFLASDCSQSTSTCNGIYTFTYGCTECPSDRWPVCDIVPSVDLSSELCHPYCLGCTGSTADDCMFCSGLYMNQSSGTCECPTNSSLVNAECVCGSSYFMMTSGSVNSCESCSDPCSECIGSSSFCTSCVQTGANLDSSLGVCSCPSKSTSNSSSCDCDEGYFLELKGSIYECSVCSFPCSECSGSSMNCTGCAASYNLSGSSCVCPNDSAVVSNQCKCDPGLFLQFTTQYNCVLCASPCQECSGTSTTCTTCVTTFNLSGTSCVCPSDSTLVSNECQCNSRFYLTLGSEYECIPCTVPCSECSGSPTTCTACVTSYNLSGSSCVCPNDSIVVSDQCKCDPGFFLQFSTQYNCVLCSSPCQECSGTSTTCTTCVTTFNLSGTSCVCPSHSTLASNECQCNSGFYLTLGSEYECIPCTAPCSECSGSPTTCTACVASYNLSRSSCVCPNDSAVVSDQCKCDPGFFLQFSTQYNCALCSSPCQECSGTSTTCSACLPTFNLDGSSCECPQTSSLDLNECQCDQGKILILDSVYSIYSCQDCLFPCLTCSGSLETCTSCEEPFYLAGSACQCPQGSSLSDNQCLCDPGFFLSLTPDSDSDSDSDSDYECSECSYPCSQCSITSSNCTQCLYTSSNIQNGTCVCPENSSLDSETCVCDQGYFMASNNGVYECLECDSPCKECSGSGTFCVSCSVSNAVLEEEEGSCSCPENSRESEGECVCEDGFFLKDSKCYKTQEIELESFDSVDSIVISTVLAISSVSTVLASDPSSVWMILNSIQILSYLPLHGLILPPNLEATCNAFRLSSLLPNVSIYLFGDELNTEGLPKKWAEKGIERTHFVLNIGQILFILFFYFFYLLIILVLVCIKKNKYIKYLKEFRYNVVLRVWVEIFIEVFVASLISFNLLLWRNYRYENLIGGAVFVVQIGSILFLWRKLYKIKNEFEETPENIRNRFSSLFYEFDLDRSEDSYLFYIYFMIRRAIHIIGLYYLHSSPLFQLIVSINCSVIHILILLLIVKFNDKLNQAVTIGIEALFCVIYLLILYYNSEFSKEEEAIIDCLSVGVVGLMGSILMMNHLAKTYSGLSEKCRTEQVSVIDESAAVGVYVQEESKIFALSQNRKKYNPHESLNLEDIY